MQILSFIHCLFKDGSAKVHKTAVVREINNYGILTAMKKNITLIAFCSSSKSFKKCPNIFHHLYHLYKICTYNKNIPFERNDLNVNEILQSQNIIQAILCVGK